MQASILPIVWSFSSKSAPNGSSPDLLKRNWLNLNLTCSKILVFKSETSWKDRRLKISIFPKGMAGHFKIKVSKKLLDRSMKLFRCSNGSKLSLFHVLSWDFSVPKSLQNTELVIDWRLFFSWVEAIKVTKWREDQEAIGNGRSKSGTRYLSDTVFIRSDSVLH